MHTNRLLHILPCAFGLSACFKDETRTYEFNDLSKLSLSIRDDKGTEEPGLPADPAVQSAAIKGAELRRTPTSIDIVVDKDTQHIVDDRSVTFTNVFTQPAEPSDPNGELRLEYSHVLSSSSNYIMATNTIVSSWTTLPTTIRTPWKNVRVVDHTATAGGAGGVIFYGGVLSLTAGLGLSLAGCSGCGSVPVILDVTGVAALVGGYLLTLPRTHERWRGF